MHHIAQFEGGFAAFTVMGICIVVQTLSLFKQGKEGINCYESI